MTTATAPRMTDSDLAVRLVTVHQFDRALFDRDPETAESLDGFNARAATVLDALAGEVAAAESIAADRDLSAEGKSKRIAERFGAFRTEALSLLDKPLAQLRQTSAMIDADIAQAGRPTPGGEAGAVLHELRVLDARRQLEQLDLGEVTRLVLERAAAGDPVPVDAVERSYVPIVAPEVIARGREALALAKRSDLATHRDAAARRLDLAERVRALTLARVESAGRRLGALPAVGS